MIRDASKDLKSVMREFLGVIAEDYIAQITKKANKATPSQKVNATKKANIKGVTKYKQIISELMATLAIDAISQAKKEVPKNKFKFAEMDDLPPDLRKKLKLRLDLLIGKQIGDLQSVIDFAYANNEGTTDSINQIKEDLNDSALDWLDGTTLQAGAEITASTVISSAREAFFLDPEVEDEIEAYEFVNGDPVSKICKDLAGTVFAKDDPNAFRYTPPLHWNCKSWIRPILKGNLGNKEISKLKPSTKEIENTIQFSENVLDECPCCHGH